VFLLVAEYLTRALNEFKYHVFIMSFIADFLEDTGQIIRQINYSDVEAVVDILASTRDRGGRLFLAGSGGGAGHSSHAACDFRKLCGLEAYCVTDNVSELTARINDEGWESSLAMWLKSSRMSNIDTLLVFSVGGGSQNPDVSVNLVRAVEFAIGCGADVVGIVGRDGGFVRKMSSASVLIPSRNPKHITPQVEGLQAVIWHLLVSHPKLSMNSTKWESLSK